MAHVVFPALALSLTLHHFTLQALFGSRICADRLTCLLSVLGLSDTRMNPIAIQSLFTKLSFSWGSISPPSYVPFLFLPLSLLGLFLFLSQVLLEASYEKEIIYNGTGTLKASVSLEIIELMRGSH